MAGSSASDVPTTTDDNAFSIINKHIQDLHKKRDDDSVCKSERQESSDTTIVDCIDELEKLLEKVRGPAQPEKEAAPHLMLGQFQVPLDGSSMPISSLVQPNKPVPKSKPGRSRMNENKRSLAEPYDKSRYLCITDGFVICCLDLKHSKDESVDSHSAPQPVTKISTLKLLEKGLPASIGLFKFGPDVYMIGGQEFPSFKKDSNIWGMRLYHDLYKRHGVKGSSCEIYRVSLANGSLSVSKCNNIQPMNKPKFWPIIEKIGGQLHVIESLPFVFANHCPDRTPSHEVLDLSDHSRGWIELKPCLSAEDEEFDLHVWGHSVLGDRIYARAHRITEQYLVFHSKTKNWELHDYNENRYNNHVNDITDFELGCCSQGFLAGELIEPLYVVVGIQKHGLGAYLVTRAGEFVGQQCLSDLLQGFEKPFSVSQGTLINVDDENIEKGKTMCAILQVNVEEGCREGYLYISTFTMEEVVNARKLHKAGEWGKDKHFGSKDFVKVVVKQRYVYKTEGYLGAEGDIGDSVRLRACFL